MILYLVGISCVGKSTIGEMLAEKIGFSFFDLDLEIQKYYKKPIERIQNECFSMNGYRKKGSVVLDFLLQKNIDCVIAGTPSGLKYSYLQVYKKHKAERELYSIHINDLCENILERITFYDEDSNPIIEELDGLKKIRYLHEIKEDYAFFKNSYQRADIRVDINGVVLSKIPTLILGKLQENGVVISIVNQP
jgi:shikimate kinase